jgi:hypothetical protein
MAVLSFDDRKAWEKKVKGVVKWGESQWGLD